MYGTINSKDLQRVNLLTKDLQTIEDAIALIRKTGGGIAELAKLRTKIRRELERLT